MQQTFNSLASAAACSATLYCGGSIIFGKDSFQHFNTTMKTHLQKLELHINKHVA
jgi:hypothetical protein